MSDNRKDVQRAINAWAQALRGDWGTIDGRSCRDQLQELTKWLDEDAEEIGYEDLCRIGNVCYAWQSWPEHCEERINSYECIHMDENSYLT